jgi:hypothetical protein
MMDTTTANKRADTSGRKKTWVTKLRRWFSRQPSQGNPKTEDPGQTDANAATSPRGEAETTSHGERVSPATGKDKREDNEEAIDDAGSSAPPPAHDEADAQEEANSDDDKDMESASASRPLRDFWAEAWNSNEVGEERRALLKGKWQGRNSLKLVEDVVQNTQDKMASYKARWGSEDDKTALGKTRSILESALTVKNLFDAGLKFDPTGYGSAAWTVLSFGLTV